MYFVIFAALQNIANIAKSQHTVNSKYHKIRQIYKNTTNIMKEKVINLLQKQLEFELFKYNMEKERNNAIMVQNVKQGDNTTQTNNTFQAVEPASDHTDQTAKLLTTAIA